jgi:hypothetical protein
MNFAGLQFKAVRAAVMCRGLLSYSAAMVYLIQLLTV